MTPVTRRVLGK